MYYHRLAAREAYFDAVGSRRSVGGQTQQRTLTNDRRSGYALSSEDPLVLSDILILQAATKNMEDVAVGFIPVAMFHLNAVNFPPLNRAMWYNESSANNPEEPGQKPSMTKTILIPGGYQ